MGARWTRSLLATEASHPCLRGGHLARRGLLTTVRGRSTTCDATGKVGSQGDFGTLAPQRNVKVSIAMFAVVSTSALCSLTWMWLTSPVDGVKVEAAGAVSCVCVPHRTT